MTLATRERVYARRQVATERFILSTLPVLYLPLWKKDSLGVANQFLSSDGHGYLAAVTGATWGLQGRTFAGGDDYIKNTTANWQSADSSGTVIVWYKSSTTTIDHLFATTDEATNDKYLSFAITGTLATGGIRIDQKDGTTRNVVDTLPVGTTNGAWHQIAFISSGTAWSAYLDAVSKAIPAIAGSNNGNWFADTPDRDNFSIGAKLSLTPSAYFTGVIGEILVYNRDLSAEEVMNNFQATKWRYK